MTDREAFIRSICEAPEDDTRRLAYADWLDEHADGPAERVRARFIRHQIAEAWHNLNVYYPAFERMRDEWDNGPGKSDDGPIRPSRDTAAGREYFAADNTCRLMQTQTRLMLERYAGEWLAELAHLVLPPEYYAWRQVGTKKRLPPDVVVRSDDFRGWIEFTAESPSDPKVRLSNGPLFSFRRGFVWQINFYRFYQPIRDDVLAEVFRCCPIERVRSNRIPAEHRLQTFGPGGQILADWHWCADDYADHDIYPADGLNYPLAALPDRVYDHLPNHKQLRGCYPDRASADADFQWASVAIGRRLAGLSELPPPTCPQPHLVSPNKKAKPRKAKS